MRSRFRPGYWAVVCVLASLGAAFGATAASAVVTFTVDSVLDQIDDDTADGLCHTAANTCTLRAAVMQANLASGAGATILLPAGIYTLTRPAQGANGPDNGDLNLTTPAAGNPLISIVGAGQTSTIIDANQIDRVLKVASSRMAEISNLTLRNGFVASYGGGIYNSGTLTMTDCAITGNSSQGGGGIYTEWNLTIVRSAISGNTGLLGGGGIFVADELLSITGSTISHNIAHGDGGGISALGSVVLLTNTTISANSADGDGGGIDQSATSTHIYSSTIVDNTADADADPTGGIGGGISVFSGSVDLSNTLVAGNTLFNQPIYDDCWGALTSYRSNLLWEVSNQCTISVGGGDGWAFLNSLAFLGQLQKNGGRTETIALLIGSNAIDSGDSTLGCTGPVNEVLASDQRGAPRAWGGRCDVGAYEAGPLFFDGFESGDLAAW